MPEEQEIPNPYGMDFDGQIAGLAEVMRKKSEQQQAADTVTVDTNQAQATTTTEETAAATTTTETQVAESAATTTETVKPEWYTEPAKYPGEEATVDTTQEAQAAQTTESPFKEYEPLLSDPEVKAILELKKAGKSVRDYAEQFRTVDFKGMTGEDLLKYELKQYDAPEDEIIAALEEYESKPTWQKNKETNERRNHFASEQDSRLATLASNIQQEHVRSSQEQQAYYAQMTQEREAAINDMVGKEYMNFVVTDREAKVVRYRFEHGFPELFQKKADGTPDYSRFHVKNFIDFVMKQDFSQGIVHANVSKAHSGGKEVIIDKVTNADKGNQGTGAQTLTDPTQALQAVATDFFKPNF